jgi:hypothetical protein
MIASEKKVGKRTAEEATADQMKEIINPEQV